MHVSGQFIQSFLLASQQSALQDRINDCEAKVVITSDIGLRGGKQIPLKEITNEALKEFNQLLIVLFLTKGDIEIPKSEFDVSWTELVERQSTECQAEAFDAETHSFYFIYIWFDGETKASCIHLEDILHMQPIHTKRFSIIKMEILIFCAADIGWVTGHSYIIYGRLVNGATTVMFESTPMYPNPDRYWKIIDDLNVNIFYTAPTALRALAQKEINGLTVPIETL